jgi:hypothetical protein
MENFLSENLGSFEEKAKIWGFLETITATG